MGLLSTEVLLEYVLWPSQNWNFAFKENLHFRQNFSFFTFHHTLTCTNFRGAKTLMSFEDQIWLFLFELCELCTRTRYHFAEGKSFDKDSKMII